MKKVIIVFIVALILNSQDDGVVQFGSSVCVQGRAQLLKTILKTVNYVEKLPFFNK